MAKRHGPGIRCAFCGCTLDPGERCDCKEREAQAFAKQKARRLQLIERNRRLLEKAFAEYDCI